MLDPEGKWGEERNRLESQGGARLGKILKARLRNFELILLVIGSNCRV